MEANRVPKIFGPFSDVFEDKGIDIQPSGPEQPNNIGGPIIPEVGNSPIPVSDVRTDTRCSLVMCFFDESDKFLGYQHLAKQTSASGRLSRVPSEEKGTRTERRRRRHKPQQKDLSGQQDCWSES